MQARTIVYRVCEWCDRADERSPVDDGEDWTCPACGSHDPRLVVAVELAS